MLIAVTETRDNERGPLLMEKVLDVLHQISASRLPVSFEFGCFRDSVGLYCRFPPELNAPLTQQLATTYPDSSVKLLLDDALRKAFAGVRPGFRFSIGWNHQRWSAFPP